MLAAALGISVWAPWRSGSSPRSSALRFTPLSFEQGGQTGAVWSPDGKAVAFGALWKNTGTFQVYVRYLDWSVATRITQLDENAVPFQWTSAGRIVFVSDKAPAGLWSISPVGGEPEPFQAVDNSAVAGSVSRDGTAVAALRRGEDRPASSLSPALRLSLSPDGKSLTYGTVNSTSNLWLMAGLDTVALPQPQAP